MRRILCLLVVWSVSLVALPAADDPGEDVRLRLKVSADAEDRDWLSANDYDIAGYALREGWVEVITDRAGAEALGDAGFGFAVLEVRDDRIDAPLPDTNYTDPAEVDAFLSQTAADHPTITRLEAIGTSHQGRTIYAMLISDNAAVDEDELTILYNGQHHAREVMTPEIIMDTIDYLTDNYPADPDVQRWVDSYQIWCVVSVNPDGNNQVHQVDDFWRKNGRDNDGDTVLEANEGVDLNRNYEWGWGYQCRGSSSSTTSATYRGPYEGSEPEPQAMMALGGRIRPVFNVEYHSYGEDVFYALSCDPDAFSPTLDTIAGPDQEISRVIAEGYAAEIVQADGGIGFTAAPFGSRVDGTGRDHQFHDNGAIGFVTEVNNSTEGGFHPNYNIWRDATVQGQRPGWQWLLDRIEGPAVGGHVLDAVSGQPLEADVSLDELHLPDGKRLTSRGDTGRFHIIVVDGDYTLRVNKPGYDEAVVQVNVNGSFQPLTVNLQPDGSTLLASDDLEDPGTPAAWTAGDPADTATDGFWEWGAPHGTHTGDVQGGNLRFGNARFDRSPGGEDANAWVTGNALTSSITSDDVEGGVTTLESPSYDLSGHYAVTLNLQRWFVNDGGDPSDELVTEVSNDGGGSWLQLDAISQTTATADASHAWNPAALRIDDIVAPGPDVRFRFRANNDGLTNTVEAAIDEIEIYGHALATAGQIANVRVSDPADTLVEWDVLAGAADATYDVARGDLANLSGGDGAVSLGPLICIEENSIDTATLGDEDAAVPTPGQGFFYVVRFNLGFSTGEWGRGSEGGERGGSGGCSP